MGLGVSAVLQTVVTGIFYFSVCRTYIPWFGSKRPSLPLVKRFLKLSGWFLAWDVVVNMTVASDVVVLGVFKSVEAVPTYTLTKYIPETAITIIAIIVVGIIPGLGGIIGMGDLKRATQVRGEIFSLTWLVITVMGTSILLWNRVFLNLWVGSGHYAGAISNLLIIIVITQYVLIRTDGFIIDLTLNIRRKVVFGFVSACISIIIGGILVKYFNLGIIGICLGLIVGRLMLSVAYPLNVSHFLKISFPTQLKGIIRPAIVTTLLFSAACVVDYFLASHELLGLSGWLVLILGAASSALAVLLITFFIGLKQDQRNNIISRLRMVLSV